MVYLDSRDLEKELVELQEAKEDGEDFDEDRLKDLEELKEELSGYGWDYGITLIQDYDFRGYADEFFDECYANEIPENIKTYINYQEFADDLEQDYSSVDFDGGSYLWREA